MAACSSLQGGRGKCSHFLGPSFPPENALLSPQHLCAHGSPHRHPSCVIAGNNPNDGANLWLW